MFKNLHKPVRKTMVPLPLEHNKNIKPKAGFRITVLGYVLSQARKEQNRTT